MKIKELTKFSRREYHSTKCGSDLQKFKHDMYLKILASKYKEFLGKFPSEHSIHICTRFCCQFYHSHDSWLHHCCWSDQSQYCCHNQWNFWFCRFKSVRLQAEFSISDSMPEKGKDLLEDVLPKKMIRKLNFILLLTVWW